MTDRGAPRTDGTIPRRFLGRLTLVGVVALTCTAFGIAVARTCAALCFGSAAIMLLHSVALGERLNVPHFTLFDEATWLFVLGHLAASAAA